MKLKTVLSALVCLVVTQVQAAMQLDYVGNITATNKDWFYQEVDSSGIIQPKPSGGGTFYQAWDHSTMSSYTTLDSPGVVYKRGQEVKLRLRVENTKGYSRSATILVASDTSPFGTDIAGINGAGNVTVTVPANSAAYTTEVSLGTLPNKVGSGTVVLLIYGGWSDQESIGDFSMTNLYHTYDTPTGFQTVPWLELVSDGCQWASGGDDEEETMTGCTNFVFWGANAYYPGDTGARWKSGSFFQLKLWLEELDPRAMNCFDCSDLVHLTSSAQGVSTNRIMVEAGGSHLGERFVTHPICLIGSDASQLWTYQQRAWGCHQIVTYGSGKVADACSGVWQIPSTGADHRNPTYWELIAPYWQFSLSTVPFTSRGLVKRIEDPQFDTIYSGASWWYSVIDSSLPSIPVDLSVGSPTTLAGVE